jgi:glycosyltransferase involved in cell wall biosynthesis
VKISVITAVKNGAVAIAETIGSVNAQTYRDIEHVIVDGASSDATIEIARTHMLRPTLLSSEPDAGIYDAFNKGLKLCTGDVVAFLNCGDTYANPSTLSDVMAHFDRQPLEAIYGDVVIVDQRDKGRVVRRYRSGRFKRSLLKFGFMPAHPGLFLRREIYERYGPYDATYRIAGDFEYVVRLFSEERIMAACVPDVLVRMARGGASTAGFRSNWIITKEMRRACRKYGVRTNVAKLLIRIPIKATELLFFR